MCGYLSPADVSFCYFFRFCAVRYIRLVISSAFERTLIYRNVSYRIVPFVTYYTQRWATYLRDSVLYKVSQNSGLMHVCNVAVSFYLSCFGFISERTTLRSLYAIGRPSVCLSVCCL